MAELLAGTEIDIKEVYTVHIFGGWGEPKGGASDFVKCLTGTRSQLQSQIDSLKHERNYSWLHAYNFEKRKFFMRFGRDYTKRKGKKNAKTKK